MGACSSCLSGRDLHDSESTRLLDEDIYQSGYNYGTVQGQQPQRPDTEDIKREREALEAICQRASESVVDIWAVQSQPFATTTPPTRSNFTSNATSRVPSSEVTVTQATARPASPHSPTPGQQGQDDSQSQAYRVISPIPGEFGGMRYVACRNAAYPETVDLSAVPKHWGEVVMTKKKGKKGKPQPAEDKDVFGVLVVQ